jgi:hypothetical protein
MSITQITILPDETDPTRAHIFCRQFGLPNRAQQAIDTATATALDALTQGGHVTGVTHACDDLGAPADKTTNPT